MAPSIPRSATSALNSTFPKPISSFNEETIDAALDLRKIQATECLPLKKRVGEISSRNFSSEKRLPNNDMAQENAYATEANGMLTSKFLWSFSAVKTLPLKKRFINVDLLKNNGFAEQFDHGTSQPLTNDQDEGHFATKLLWNFSSMKMLPLKKRFVDIESLATVAKKRSRSDDSLNEANAKKCEEMAAKRPRLGNKENVMPNITAKTSSGAGKSKINRRSLQFKRTRPIQCLQNKDYQSCTLSKWANFNALNDLTDTELDSTTQCHYQIFWIHWNSTSNYILESTIIGFRVEWISSIKKNCKK